MGRFVSIVSYSQPSLIAFHQEKAHESTNLRMDLCFKLYYKVVTCGDYMTGEQRHDQKEFVWTLYKNKEEWENSTK